MKKILFILVSVLGVSGCASAPKVGPAPASPVEAARWLGQYCSKTNFKTPTAELTGEAVMKSNTKEFRGQYPASIRFEPSGAFFMEVTNILGGTLLGIQGTPEGLNIQVPSRPKYDRKNVKSYLGLELEILMQLLHGDLPCPTAEMTTAGGVKVGKGSIEVETRNWIWSFQRALPLEGSVPVHVRLMSNSKGAAGKPPVQIDLKVDDWDMGQNYARKVEVISPEGSLKWTWRTRQVKVATGIK